MNNLHNPKFWSKGFRSAAWIALALLLFLYTASLPPPLQPGVAAQDLPDQGFLPPPPPDPTPSMSFQPAADAAQWPDFYPTDAVSLTGFFAQPLKKVQSRFSCKSYLWWRLLQTGQII